MDVGIFRDAGAETAAEISMQEVHEEDKDKAVAWNSYGTLQHRFSRGHALGGPSVTACGSARLTSWSFTQRMQRGLNMGKPRVERLKTTGNGSPPILLVWADDQNDPGFDCIFLSQAMARAIIEFEDTIRRFAGEDSKAQDGRQDSGGVG